ncbi:LOW QUALITY PROTEIN: rap1 GTPase-GDP dissociation stimulator 1-B [Pogonomyrmex barbatus]|uniref:LOW QUALITY PROTEIN: rap1 GTPase-GDP dissociation stimulator 1-B n=1 Tax=Pogonomyrmex barbatus TaxID=144034 RepID=A0A6I9X5L7_9HYME|nr:LOW QUALITY PROTEIN: rap1 GTPase-GDP dissociation stimulator 1-B [Pogonomyrmex barbatus]
MMETEGKVKHNIDKLVDDLKCAVRLEVSEEKCPGIVQILDSVVNVSKTSIGEATELVIDEVFLILLGHKSKEIVAKTAKAIAEITKTDQGRERCTTIELIWKLIDLLKEEDIDILTQASRALGNICYENENGKNLVREQDGLRIILMVLKKGIALDNVEGAGFLRDVAAGLLLNFLVDQETLYRKALEENMIPIICSILDKDGISGGEAAVHALLTLSILNDVNIIFLDERLTKVLVDILANDTSSELSEMCLELLHGQAEDEKAKLLLAKAGVCELLLKLLEKHGPQCNDEETRSILKVACNLIVLILTGDDSMNFLYDDSKGSVYRKLVEWLESVDDDLQITAVLAMANFARTDTHCKHMVEQGVHRKLLKLLEKNGTKSGDIRCQHALLSALRNLVIPADNKSLILADGLIDVLYPMLEIPTFPVVFKLLGTLRMVIDRQREAAISLGQKEDLIKRTVEWCSIEDHPGVQGEANRLIAWLINNSRDKQIALSIIKYGAVQHLVDMLLAQHAVMQNEAILALTILMSICPIESEELLIKAGFGRSMCEFFEARANDLDIHIVLNALSLLDSVLQSDQLKEHLKSCGLANACKSLRLQKNENAALETLELQTRVTNLRAALSTA